MVQNFCWNTSLTRLHSAIEVFIATANNEVPFPLSNDH